MSKKTYSARELVLSLFPGTDAALVPLPEPYRFELAEGGLLRLLRDGTEIALLAPVAPAGNASTQLCCDLCKWSASRHYLQLFRAEVPGSKGGATATSRSAATPPVVKRVALAATRRLTCCSAECWGVSPP